MGVRGSMPERKEKDGASYLTILTAPLMVEAGFGGGRSSVTLTNFTFAAAARAKRQKSSGAQAREVISGQPDSAPKSWTSRRERRATSVWNWKQVLPDGV